MKFNTNETVKGILTESGAEIYNRQKLDVEPELSAGDTIEKQLWVFMAIFGPYLSLGKGSPVRGCSLEFSVPVGLPPQFAVKLSGQSKYWDFQDEKWVDFSSELLTTLTNKLDVAQGARDELVYADWRCEVVRVSMFEESVK